MQGVPLEVILGIFRTNIELKNCLGMSIPMLNGDLFLNQEGHRRYYYHGLAIKAWINNHTHGFMWDVIGHPCPNLRKGGPYSLAEKNLDKKKTATFG